MRLRHPKKLLSSVLLAIAVLASLVKPVSAWIFSSKTELEPTVNQIPRNDKQVNALNEQAVDLFEQGRFEEAQALWEKAIGLLELPGGVLDEEMVFPHVAWSTDRELDVFTGEEDLDTGNVDKFYETAVALFKKEKYVASKKMFEKIEMVLPDYKASRNYLTILAHKIKQAEQMLGGRKFKETASARREERMEWERILEESRIELEKKLADQVEPIYREAVEYYKSRDFRLAKDYFAEVEDISPNYKDTKKYLARVDRDIRKEEERLLEERRKREILARKKEKEEWRRILKESEEVLQKKLIEQTEPIYKEAIERYKARDFELAKSRFEEVQSVIPNYKSTGNYLGRIEKDIENEALLRQERRAREMERKKSEEELARRREADRLRQMREETEQKKIEQFQAEIAARHQEREEWMRILEESEKERERKIKEQAATVYKFAVSLYKRGDFLKAKEKFLEVEQALPGYKSAKKYLKRVDRDIITAMGREQKEKQLAFERQIREQRLEQRREEDRLAMIKTTEEERGAQRLREEARVREKERAEWEKTIAEIGKEHEKRLKSQVESIYQEAIRYYQAGWLTQAKETFHEVDTISSGYKSTRDYLVKIDADIRKDDNLRKESEETILNGDWSEERWTGQKQAFEAYVRDSDLPILERNGKAVVRNATEKRREEFSRAAESKYREAVTLYKAQEFMEAKLKFIEVESLSPGYKSTLDYLTRIDRDIEAHHGALAFQPTAQAIISASDQKLPSDRKQVVQQALREVENYGVQKQTRERVSPAPARAEAAVSRDKGTDWERHIERRREGLKVQRRLAREKYDQQFKELYTKAVRLYRDGSYEEAKGLFLQIEQMRPGYKRAASYLKKAQARTNKGSRQRSNNFVMQPPEGNRRHSIVEEALDNLEQML